MRIKFGVKYAKSVSPVLLFCIFVSVQVLFSKKILSTTVYFIYMNGKFNMKSISAIRVSSLLRNYGCIY